MHFSQTYALIATSTDAYDAKSHRNVDVYRQQSVSFRFHLNTTMCMFSGVSRRCSAGCGELLTLGP